jgi:hypothetical protein
MRRLLAVTAFGTMCVLSLCIAAQADTIQLTGGTIQFYLGDKNSARLIGDGFEVSTLAGGGGWPIGLRPGEPVDFSTDVTFSDWGQATVNGTQLHGAPSAPAAGRLWITGAIHVVATPFIAPPPSDFTGSFQAAVAVSGFVSGYVNADVSLPPLFTAVVSGKGSAQGVYRVMTTGTARSYLDNCCASVTIDAPRHVDQRLAGETATPAGASSPSDTRVAPSPCDGSASSSAPCLRPTAGP